MKRKLLQGIGNWLEHTLRTEPDPIQFNFWMDVALTFDLYCTYVFNIELE